METNTNKSDEQSKDGAIAVVLGIILGWLSVHYFLLPLFTLIGVVKSDFGAIVLYAVAMLLCAGTAMGAIMNAKAQRNLAYAKK